MIGTTELVFDQNPVVGFISGAGEDVGSKRADPVFHSLDFDLNTKQFTQESHGIRFSKPWCEVTVLGRPRFCQRHLFKSTKWDYRVQQSTLSCVLNYCCGAASTPFGCVCMP